MVLSLQGEASVRRRYRRCTIVNEPVLLGVGDEVRYLRVRQEDEAQDVQYT